MTLERLLSFIGTVIRRDTRRMSRGLIPARRVACVLNETRTSHVKGMMSPQLRRTCGNAPKTWNSHLTKTASLQRSHLFSKTKAAPSQQSESCVFTLQIASLQRSYFFNKLIDASPLWVRTASLKQHDPCVYKTYIQSLLLQISSTVHWHKQTTVYPWFNSIPTISSEHWGGLNCVSRHSSLSSLVASKGFTVHSRRPYSRQDQAHSIFNDCQSNHEKYEFN